MEGKTTLNIVGSLVFEIPSMMVESAEMASGNVLAYVNAGIKAVDSIAGIVKLCIDKNNTKLVREAIDNFDNNEKQYQNEMEQVYLQKKIEFINGIKEDFLKRKNDLEKKYLNEKKNSYINDIRKKQELSESMTQIRDRLKELIDFYEKEISVIVDSEEYSSKEKRHFEECKRLLLKQYSKNIDI